VGDCIRLRGVVAGVHTQGTPRGGTLVATQGSSQPLQTLHSILGAEAATRPATLCLAALWACRAAPADKFSDDELGSYKAGTCDQARHRW
jgi:hypothetical protein